MDWKGEFIDNNISKNQSSPSDSEFKDLYEIQINQYFNPNENYIPDDNYLTNIPVLDDNFTSFEVKEQIKKLKSNKSCGPDGIPPGIYKLLNNEWILLLTSLFNIIFSNAIYPLQWSNAKLFMLFKRGNRNDPNNYRGISVINSVSKIFDMIICNRLDRWFKPDREQAGAQSGRGCIEQIVTLRILCDYAKKKKNQAFYHLCRFFHII